MDKRVIRNFLLILITGLVLTSGVTRPVIAAEQDTRIIPVRLGDYRFMPHEIMLKAGQPVILQLTNTDSITPHNFTLEDPDFGLDVDEDVEPGQTVEVHLLPLWAGKFTFYCNQKLWFFESHRDKGMTGTITVE